MLRYILECTLHKVDFFIICDILLCDMKMSSLTIVGLVLLFVAIVSVSFKLIGTESTTSKVKKQLSEEIQTARVAPVGEQREEGLPTQVRVKFAPKVNFDSEK